ncbi:MAG TPA: hypothetical protein VHZ55_19945 [Bryobacteraceae bacterium]|jgi:hypothetical protein|nr:hypothetical protein [Bryobacteraceae bacterium]
MYPFDCQSAELIVDTPGQDVLPQVTPDGRWVLYAWNAGDALAGIRKLMRVSLAGGQPEPVAIGGALGPPWPFLRLTANILPLGSHLEPECLAGAVVTSALGAASPIARYRNYPAALIS